MDVMVQGEQTTRVARLLHEREMPFYVALPDVHTMCRMEKVKNKPCCKEERPRVKCPPPPCPPPPCSPPPCSPPVCSPRSCTPNPAPVPVLAPCSPVPRIHMDWKKYHRLETIYKYMDDLACNYPDLCTVNCIGKTAEGRGIKLLRISNGNECNQGVWLDGATHGREWISVAVVTYIVDQLVNNYNCFPSCVTDKDWYIVPVVNPDGYEYTHTTDRMWRKNRARYGDCVGVDLNRNWSYGFGEKGEEGSSEDPGSIFFRGPKPFSEKETCAIKNVIEKCAVDFKVFLSCHSYGESIIFPWGYTADPCPDYVKLLEGGTAMAKGIYEVSGQTYKVGSTKDLMYYASGTSIDWSYGVGKIPFSYMIELRGKKDRFLLPCECIIPTATEVMNGLICLLQFICSNSCMTHDACSCSK